MLVFFLKSAKLDPKGFNLIFYTGKEVLPDTIENCNGNVNLTIVRERPNLAHVIPNIIQDIDKYGHSQAEAELPDPEMVALAMLHAENKRLLEISTQVAVGDKDKGGKMTNEERVAKLAAYAEDELGFNLTQLVNEIPNVPGIGGDNNGDASDANNVTNILLGRIEKLDLNAEEILENYDPLHIVKPTEYIHEGRSVWSTGTSERNLVSGSGVRTATLYHEHQPLLEEDEEELGLEEKLVPPSSSSSSSKVAAGADAINDGSILSNYALSRRGVERYASRLMDQHEHGQFDEEEATVNAIWKEDKSARPYVHSMPDKNIETWAFFYCGGRNPLLEALVKESEDLSIPLHEEAFDW
jgi:hypothetical protein